MLAVRALAGATFAPSEKMPTANSVTTDRPSVLRMRSPTRPLDGRSHRRLLTHLGTHLVEHLLYDVGEQVDPRLAVPYDIDGHVAERDERHLPYRAPQLFLRLRVEHAVAAAASEVA